MAGILAISFSSPAYAVRVSMKRIVFDGSKKSEVITIINNSGEEKTYRLGWRHYRMDSGESLVALDGLEGADMSDILWADKMVRFAPRRVSVPAGSSQQIRLLFRRPANLQEAEYRSHLWIVEEGKPDAFVADSSQTKQQVRLAVQPAISLPIFVRNGNLKVETSITGASLAKTNEGLKVAFTLNRSGNRSIYGDFDFVCTDAGSNTVLKQVRGIAVYTDTEHRNLDFDITKKDGVSTSCDSVKVVYRADPNDRDFGGKLLAEATATLK